MEIEDARLAEQHDQDHRRVAGDDADDDGGLQRDGGEERDHGRHRRGVAVEDVCS